MEVPFGCPYPLPHPHLSYTPPVPVQHPPFLPENHNQNGQTVIDILMKFHGSTLQVSLPPPPPNLSSTPPSPSPAPLPPLNEYLRAFVDMV